MKLKLSNVRLAFPSLWKATSIVGSDGKPSEPKFGASFLIEPTNAQIAFINKSIDEVALEKWGVKTAPVILKGMRATDKVCLHDGNLKAQYAGFEGMLYISSTAVVKPIVVSHLRANGKFAELDQQGNTYGRDEFNKLVPVDVEGEVKVPYGGCYVNAVIELWAQDNSFGKRVNAGLLSVQFYKDGDSFSGGSIGSASDFDDLAVEDEADADLV